MAVALTDEYDADLVIADAPPPVPTRSRVLLVGTVYASAACVMFFVGLMGVYLQLRSVGRLHGGTWLPQAVHIPLTQPNVMLFTLLMSSVTVQWAVFAAKDDDRRHLYLAIGVSLLLAFAFINQAAYLYTLMGLDVHGNQQSVLIYTITGAQLAMLVAAMVFLVLMGFRSLVGSQTSTQRDGITAAAIFWHATSVVYLLIWFAIYVTK
jgi:heme/copper-type cytochrome/quinol oxidase subunit 3